MYGKTQLSDKDVRKKKETLELKFVAQCKENHSKGTEKPNRQTKMCAKK
jgi:hypothetical protein